MDHNTDTGTGEDGCACGNGPLTAKDKAAGGACACCRTKHLYYHDDRACRRCGCPRTVSHFDGKDATDG